MKVEFSGFREFADSINLFTKKSVLKEVSGKMLYEGSKVVADRIKQNIKSLPTASGWATSDNPRNGATPKQKAGLLNGFGISRMKGKGNTYDLAIGFDGYNGQKTKKFPKGQPNMMIARAIEGGTSFMNAHPFVMPAIRASLPTAEDKMIKTFDEFVEEKLK